MPRCSKCNNEEAIKNSIFCNACADEYFAYTNVVLGADELQMPCSDGYFIAPSDDMMQEERPIKPDLDKPGSGLPLAV